MSRFWQESHYPCVLDGTGNGALMLGAGSGVAPGSDFAIRIHETLKKLNVFIIDVFDFVLAEVADLFSGSHLFECHVSIFLSLKSEGKVIIDYVD